VTAAVTGSAASTGSSARTTRRSGVWQSPAVRHRTVDLGCVAALLAMGVIAWGPVFGSQVGYVAAAGGVFLGVAVAVVAAWRRWTRLGTLLASILAYLAGGGPLALPETTIGGIVPHIETIQRLTLLSWQSWRDLLTVAVPAGEFDGPLVLPFVVGLATAVIATSASLRLRRLAAVVPLTLLATLTLLVLGILWGTHSAPLASLQGGLFGAIALGWVSWRSQLTNPDATAIFRSAGTTRAPRARQIASAGVALVLATGIGGLGWALVAPDPDRHVLRDTIDPPFDPHDYPSPLTAYRYLELKLEKETLLTVDGLPGGDRIRLAAMDIYDGNVYNVTEKSAKFSHTGQTIAPGEFSDGDSDVTHLSIDIGAYDGIWLPGGGDLRRVEFDDESLANGLFYNAATGTALTTVGLAEGDHLEVDVALVHTFTTEAKDDLPSDARPDTTFPIPDGGAPVESVSNALGIFQGGAETVMDQLRNIEYTFQQGFYANGTNSNPSFAGHTAGRLKRLLDEEFQPMTGDDEQYAVAMALMARDLGLPARVVMGLYPDPKKPFVDGPLQLTGDDAHVWVEVLFSDLGWVNFDPTPDEQQLPQRTQKEPEPKEEPQVLPPPEVPEDHDLQPPPRKDSDEKQDAEERDPAAALLVLIVAAIAAGTVALLCGPFLLISYLKGRRRNRRRNARVLADRISGGWAEIIDLATDLGVQVLPPATRYESAVLLKERLPTTTTMPIAHRVDAHVFGDGEPTAVDVESVWASVDALHRDFRKTATVRDRIRQRFSLRSLVRRPAKPARGQTDANPRG